MVIDKKKFLVISFVASGILFINSIFVVQESSFEESIKRGEIIYKKDCITCHMENGEGIPGVFPPLAKSDFLLEHLDKSISAIINGLSGEISVNGQIYFGQMEPVKLTDQEIADVLNYSRNSWGNKANEIKAEEVAAQRTK
ncbi:MAG TPA: cytochrome c [Cyclobacteriaceae bacterium]|jgi:nitrite reductase (NO-forming)